MEQERETFVLRQPHDGDERLTREEYCSWIDGRWVCVIALVEADDTPVHVQAGVVA